MALAKLDCLAPPELDKHNISPDSNHVPSKLLVGGKLARCVRDQILLVTDCKEGYQAECPEHTVMVVMKIQLISKIVQNVQSNG